MLFHVHKHIFIWVSVTQLLFEVRFIKWKGFSFFIFIYIAPFVRYYLKWSPWDKFLKMDKCRWTLSDKLSQFISIKITTKEYLNFPFLTRNCLPKYVYSREKYCSRIRNCLLQFSLTNCASSWRIHQRHLLILNTFVSDLNYSCNHSSHFDKLINKRKKKKIQ